MIYSVDCRDELVLFDLGFGFGDGSHWPSVGIAIHQNENDIGA